MRRELLFCAFALCACNAVLGLDGDTQVSGGSLMDASYMDVSTTDSAVSGDDGRAPPDADAAPDGDVDAGPELQLFAGVLGGVGNGDGRNEDARFDRIIGVAADENGNHYVIESGDLVGAAGDRSTVIRKVDANRVVTTLAGSRLPEPRADGTFAEARFEDLRSITYDASNHRLWVLDGCSLRHLSLDVDAGMQVTTVVDSRVAKVDCRHADTNDNGGVFPPTTPGLADSANAIAVGSAGEVYISEPPYIRRYDSKSLDTICGADGVGPGPGDCGEIALTAQELVWAAEEKSLYFRDITDDGSLQLQRLLLAKDATLVTETRKNTVVDGGIGIAYQPGSNVLLLVEGRQIRELLASGVDDIASGSNAEAGARIDGPRLTARYEQIGAIVKRPLAGFDIGDLATLRESTADDTIGTVAGLPHPPERRNGTGSDARFGNAQSMTFANGKVYFYDAMAATVNSLDPATGDMKVLAGKAGMADSVDAELGENARFPYDAEGIVFDGNVLVLGEISPGGKRRTRQIALDTGRTSNLHTGFSLGAAFTADPATRTLYFVGTDPAVILTWKFGEPNAAPLFTSTGGNPALFKQLSGMCWEASIGGLVVVDRETNLVTGLELDPLGQPRSIIAIAGTGGVAPAHEDTTTSNIHGAFYRPDGVTCDGKGHVFVNETVTGSIRMIDLKNGSRVTTPVGGLDGQRGILVGRLPARLNAARPLALADGRLFIGSANEGAILSVFFPR